MDHFDLHGKVDIEIGTTSKAFGAMGGVVAGNKIVIEWLHQGGRPFLFSFARIRGVLRHGPVSVCP